MSKLRYLLFSLLLASSMLPLAVRAQITITPGATALALANKLAGPGVLILNPTITCPANANGIFTGVSSLGFDSGIVLTCGQATTVGTAVGAGGAASLFATTDNTTAGDAQLTTLAGQPTFDACVLEFDFRPAGDTVKFNYVFGSEEYTDFACTNFNDVFGFFISGPGYASPVNIALVPGTNVPVCINSVNCGPIGFGGGLLSTCNAVGPGSPFCAYYVDNSAGTTITYDGLTTKLTAVASVAPCDTYHLKIGIADGTDHVLDSGVFLEAGSLSSTGISINPRGINSVDTGMQFCVRGCLPGKFIFTRTSRFADTLNVHYLIRGTAAIGSDFSTIPDSVVFVNGDTTKTILIHALAVPPTGNKTVKLLILSPYTCDSSAIILDSAILTIYDSFYVHINTPDTAICAGQFAVINATGDASLVYNWSPAATLSSTTILNPTATPPVTTTYVVSAVFPGAGCVPSTAKMTITVYEKPVIDVGPAIQKTCVHIPLQLGVAVTPAGIPYTYSWTPFADLDNRTVAHPIVTPSAAGDFEYYVTVSAPVVGCSTTDSFLLHVLPDDFTLYNPDTLICFPPGTFQMRTAGDTEFAYSWKPTLGVSDPYIINPTITPFGSGTYTVTATYPRCPDMHHQITYTVERVFGDIITTDTAFCIGLPVPIPVSVYPADSAYTFVWSPTDGIVDPSKINTEFFKDVPGTYKYYLTLTNTLGCMGTDSVIYRPAPPIHIAVTPGPATIQLGGHLQLDCVNRTMNAGDLYYEWLPNDGTLNNNNINNPVATPLVTTTYTVSAMSIYGCRDTASETVTVDFTDECIPSAFTPNSDGLNDIFRLCSLHHHRLVEFTVFNRWGQMMYHNTTDPTKGWDGTFNGEPQDMGVYNYLVIVALPNGENKIYKGEVTLIR